MREFTAGVGDIEAGPIGGLVSEGCVLHTPFALGLVLSHIKDAKDILQLAATDRTLRALIPQCITQLELADYGAKELPLPLRSLEGSNVKRLHVAECEHLQSLPGLTNLPLKHLQVDSCPELQELPELCSLGYLNTLVLRNSAWRMEALPAVGGIPLTRLEIRGCCALRELPDLHGLSSLTNLTLVSCDTISWLPELSTLPSLQELHIQRLSRLEVLPALPASLSKLHLAQNDSLRQLPSFEGTALSDLTVAICMSLEGFPALSPPLPLTRLSLDWHIHNVKEPLPSLEGLPLTHLHIENCWAQLPPLRGLPLTSLSLYFLEKLEVLPDISGLPLQSLDLRECAELETLPPLAGLPLREVRVTSCRNFRRLPQVPDGAHVTLDEYSSDE